MKINRHRLITTIVFSMDYSVEKVYWEQGIQLVAGVDEAGRGPLAGPVVAASVILLPYVTIEEVNDSKKLSPRQREILYDTIRQKAVSIGIGIVSETEIDRINILQATLKAMHEAVLNLAQSPGFIIVDGNRTPEWSYKSMPLIKGDALCQVVAAASIIAKVTRDRIMIDLDKRYPEYQFAQHKGYATQIHKAAILKYGVSPVHRRTFCKNIINCGEQTNFSDVLLSLP